MAREPDTAAASGVPAPPATRQELLRAIDALVAEWRAECLWYLRADYFPATDPERRQVLEAIQERASRDGFRRAGLLKAWLSRPSSDASASS